MFFPRFSHVRTNHLYVRRVCSNIHHAEGEMKRKLYRWSPSHLADIIYTESMTQYGFGIYNAGGALSRRGEAKLVTTKVIYTAARACIWASLLMFSHNLHGKLLWMHGGKLATFDVWKFVESCTRLSGGSRVFKEAGFEVVENGNHLYSFKKSRVKQDWNSLKNDEKLKLVSLNTGKN